jgi:lysozyme
MSYLDILKRQLSIDEGYKKKMYLDSRGIWTIGIGHNLRDKPLSDRAVQVIFEDDMADAEADARILFKSFDSLNDVRKAVVVNMSFNMGFAVLSQFRQTISAIDAGDYAKAAAYMLNSRWADQVGARAQRLAEQMAKGM